MDYFCGVLKAIMKKILFNISDDNLYFLDKISKNTHTPKSKIINKIISSYIEENQNKKNHFLNYKEEKKEERSKEVRIFFTKNEYELLKKNASKNNHSFISKELRYLIFNSIYNDKFYNDIELRRLILTKTALNQLGRNLNQLNKELRKRAFLRISENNLTKLLNNILNKINELVLNIESLSKKTKDKIR